MGQKGFTLLELLISFCISACVMAGAYKVFTNLAKNYEIQESVADARSAVFRSGMTTMLEDLRMAGYDKQGGGSNVTVGTAVSGTANRIRAEWEFAITTRSRPSNTFLQTTSYSGTFT